MAKNISSITTVLWFGVICFLTGCASLATEYREEGFHNFQRGFESSKETEDVYEVIELEKVRIYIVGHRKHFQWEKAAAYGPDLSGYATTENEIYIFGKRAGDKIIVNQAILGHEMNHLLNFKNRKIANPDRLEKINR